MEKGNTLYEDGSNEQTVYNIYKWDFLQLSSSELNSILKNKNIKISYEFKGFELIQYLNNLPQVVLTEKEIKVIFYILQKQHAQFTDIRKKLSLHKGSLNYILDALVSKKLLINVVSQVSGKSYYKINPRNQLLGAYVFYVVCYSINKLGVSFDGVQKEVSTA